MSFPSAMYITDGNKEFHKKENLLALPSHVEQHSGAFILLTRRVHSGTDQGILDSVGHIYRDTHKIY